MNFLTGDLSIIITTGAEQEGYITFVEVFGMLVNLLDILLIEAKLKRLAPYSLRV